MRENEEAGAETPARNTQTLRLSERIPAAPSPWCKPSVWSSSEDEQEFLVEGFLPEACVTMLTSESGSGKSMLALDIAVRVAKGEPFAGRRTRQHPVLYFDRENPRACVLKRLRMFGATPDLEPQLQVCGLWCLEEPPAANDSRLIELVQSMDPKPLIVIDSLIEWLTASENDAVETLAVMDHFRRLAGLGATVLVLHHAGKAETAGEYRGSSSIKAAVDVAYKMKGKSQRLTKVSLEPYKERIHVDGLELSFTEHGFSPSNGAVSAIQARLTQLLRDHPGVAVSKFEELALNDHVATRKEVRLFVAGGEEDGSIRIAHGECNAKRLYLAEDEGLPIQ
jgi:RecA-family ATPase